MKKDRMMFGGKTVFKKTIHGAVQSAKKRMTPTQRTKKNTAPRKSDLQNKSKRLKSKKLPVTGENML